MIKFLTFIVLLNIARANTNTVSTDKSCLALALSGGGAKGSYEAGALYGLVKSGKGQSFAYDVVTGVSAGAINTGAISLFKPGDEDAMVQFLSDTWAGINDGNVFKNWSPFGIVTGLFSKSGILDDHPLSNFLTSVMQQFDFNIQRKIAVSCVDIISGDYVVFNETTTDIVKAIVSSASIPFAFPNVPWNNGIVCMDGGTVYNTNLASAIQRCREQVDNDSQITMDIIICDDTSVGQGDHSSNAYYNFLRYKDIKDGYQSIADVHKMMDSHPDINFRYYLQPSTTLPGGLSIINFDNTTATWPMQMTGRLDGENAVKDGEGYMFSKMREYYNSEHLQHKHGNVGNYLDHTIQLRSAVHRKERRNQEDDGQGNMIMADQPVILGPEYQDALKEFTFEQEKIAQKNQQDY